MWESDVVQRVPELENRFDLVVSWQVLEHVKPLDMAMENLRSYLRPNGRLVALLSGTFSAFGLINQVVPQRLGVWAMCKLLRRDPETVFPAYYHCCWHDALKRMLSSWQEAEVVALYRGAGYFAFSLLLQRLYLHYEEWAWCGRRYNLATHYLVQGRR
jgi:SAM-dependent methyltransferase